MATGVGAATGMGTTTPKKKTVKIKLPGDPGYVAPTGSTGGIPVVPSANKIKSVAKPVAPPITPMGSSQLTGQMPSTATNAPAPQTSNMSAASQPVNGENTMATAPFLNSWNGFANRYNSEQANAVYGNPGMILEDVFKDQGLPISNSRMAGMGDYAEQMKNLAGLIALSTGGAPEQDDTLINSIAELMQNGMGHGGGGVDAMAALTALMNPGASNSELSGYLYGMPGDKSFGLDDQNAALQPLFQASIAGVNPYTQQAMASAYRGAQNLASSDLGHGTTTNPTITQYLRNNLRGIVPGSAL